MGLDGRFVVAEGSHGLASFLVRRGRNIVGDAVGARVSPRYAKFTFNFT
jgi:hypothetical protein